MDVFDSTSPVAHPRVGLVVPKHRRNSVERNKLKRRLREVLRLQVLPRLTDSGALIDLLVRARKEAYDASFEQLHDELLAWIDKWSHAR